MTEKLYDKSPYLCAFSAKVVSCDKGQDGKYEIILDKTAFFPEGGGQTSDTGSIAGVRVFDVQINDGEIVHYAESLVPTGEAECEINFEERFRKMQNHSGEHVVSGIVKKLYGLDNVGFHVGSRDVTIDYNGELSREDLLKIEDLANRACAEDVEIIATYPDADTLKTIDYRSKKELSGDIRIVEIPGYDVCACCAPHVKSTGCIGMIKLLDMIKYKGGVRVHMKCGLDALDDFNDKYRNVYEIATLLSAKQTEAAEAVKNLLSELDKSKRAYAELAKRRVLERLEREEYKEGNMLLFESDIDADTQRAAANAGREKCSGVFLCLVGDDNVGYRYIASSKTVPLKSFFSALSLDVRGGGSDEMMQGMMKYKKDEILSAFAL